MHEFVLFECTTQFTPRECPQRFVYEGIKSGALKPIIDPKVFALDQIVDAHRYLESNQQFGKIVVKV
jgi:NADPH2:quinone reductase